MISKDQEKDTLLQAAQTEIGVNDLIQFYSDVEGIYTAAMVALQEEYISTTTNSTNIK